MIEYLLTSCLILLTFIYGIVRFRVRKSEMKSKCVDSPPPYPNWSIEKTRPLPYRPFKWGPNYFVTMGISRLDLNDWIELDNQWTKYHQHKLDRLHGERASRLCKTSPQALDAAKETIQLLSQYLVHRYPSLFRFVFNENQQKQIEIKATGEIYPIDSSDPLKYASLLIEDDLALMMKNENDEKYYLKAGSIVLPGFWRLEDKFEMSLSQIHLSGDVPQFKEKLENSMDKYFQKMTPDNPIVRYNYFIQTDGELPWSSSIGAEDTFGIGWQNAQPNPSIHDIHLRFERQTLRRLPETDAILFTIRPYLIPVTELADEPSIPGRLASAIRSWPDDVAQYKGRTVYQNILLDYLDQKHQQQLQQGLQIDNLNSYPY